MEIDLISDGTVRVDAGGPFGLVPRALYSKHLPPDEANRLPMALNCMLIRTADATILVDTGLGEKMDESARAMWGLDRTAGGLLDQLDRKGVQAEEVDLVLNTHLHADHCGGNTCSVAGSLRATFPRAEYWVQRVEWADAMHADARTRSTYLQDNFVPLMEAGRLRLLHGETQVSENIRCVPTPGHTRGHQSIVVEHGDWRAIFVADMATFAIHMARTAWLTAYDVMPLENVRTKELWQAWAVQNQAWLIFQHDIRMPIARLTRPDRRLELHPVEEAAGLTADLPKQQPPP
jgi:glyoxylase-like metal-dependent hydrolase (beta-lactamase superfamily II)